MKRFFKMSFLEFKGHLGPFHFEEFITLNLMYPFLTLVFYCILAGYAFQTKDVTEWVIGNSFLLCTNVCIFQLGVSFTTERYCGRIRSILCAPSSKFVFMLQKGFFPCLVCIVTTLVGFIAGGIVFHIPLGEINWGVFLIILFVAMLGASALGLFIGTFGLLSDQIHFILNTMSYIILIFTGANIPVQQLPKLGRIVSKMLPLTRTIEAAKMTYSKIDIMRLCHLLLGEIIVTLAYLILSCIMLHYAERVAMKKGTVDLF